MLAYIGGRSERGRVGFRCWFGIYRVKFATVNETFQLSFGLKMIVIYPCLIHCHKSDPISSKRAFLPESLFLKNLSKIGLQNFTPLPQKYVNMTATFLKLRI